MLRKLSTRKAYAWVTPLLIAVLALAYVRGLFIPLMHNDSAHHANIAVHMVNTGDYCSLVDRGTDYLDKPHFLFWSAAFWFELLGVTPLSYKLTSFLFSLLALVATYKLARLLYNRRTAVASVVVLATSFAFALGNNDVRMDAILTACIIVASWQLILLFERFHWTSLLISAAALAAGFSTKGLIGLVIPCTALFFHVLQHRGWRGLLAWQWPVVAALTLLFIIPVLYCYYLQFDLHPEKIIRGSSGHSGVKFILLGQSVERFQGERWGDTAKNNYFFFIGTFAWAFLPWSLLAFSAWWRRLKHMLKYDFKDRSLEAVTFCTTTLFFVLFSFSAFKLPHYINVLLPYFAIMTAGAITSAKLRTLREYMLTQKILGAVVVVLFGVIHVWAFPIVNPWVIAASVLLFVLIVMMMAAPGARMRQVVCLSAAMGVWIIFSLNFSYYPQLLGYQAGLPLAAAINHEKDATVAYVVGSERCNDLDFALGANVPALTPTEIEQAARPFFIVTGTKGLNMLTQSGLHYTKLAEADDFKVSKFRYSFFNPATRDGMLEKIYLLEIH